MKYSLRAVHIEDRKPIMDILNHYVEHSFAAYPDSKMPYEAFEVFLQMGSDYPKAAVTDSEGRVVGFGRLRPHNPLPSFSHTAEVTYFLHPDHTGKGIGKLLLDHLEAEARRKGVSSILASISSLNPGSIRFHQKNGFVEVGRFVRIAKKQGREFDTVWMQKMLAAA